MYPRDSQQQMPQKYGLPGAETVLFISLEAETPYFVRVSAIFCLMVDCRLCRLIPEDR